MINRLTFHIPSFNTIKSILGWRKSVCFKISDNPSPTPRLKYRLEMVPKDTHAQICSFKKQKSVFFQTYITPMLDNPTHWTKKSFQLSKCLHYQSLPGIYGILIKVTLAWNSYIGAYLQRTSIQIYLIKLSMLHWLDLLLLKCHHLKQKDIYTFMAYCWEKFP